MIRGSLVYIAGNISLPYYASVEEAFSVAGEKFKRLGIKTTRERMYIYRRSVDARKKNDIRFVYSVATEWGNIKASPEAMAKCGVVAFEYLPPEISFGQKRACDPIVVVGSGPAGMFSALLLSENGFKVKLIERGGSVKERNAALADFIKNRKLDPNTNIQFGAGGAGTFSDGKLVTRINDSMSSYILKRLVEFGAPDEILYLAKPHIGTDILSVVVDNILRRIEELGSEVLYHTELKDFKATSGKITSVVTNNGEIACTAVILAIGHSARDTYNMLLGHGLDIEAKDFSVGLRIEHLRETIDKGLYGNRAGDPLLPTGEYNLSHNTKVRGVYTFCMCPGGEVVAAASECGGVVVNGMSHHARNGKNSNSAICCSVFRNDYGGTPIAAIEFQRKIEQAAFCVAGSDYSAPIITLEDFLTGECKRDHSSVLPSYMGGTAVKLVSPDQYLPHFIVDSIKGALPSFDSRISGFASADAVLTGPETRTSAPIRIKRDPETRLATGFCNLYPAGEGAGYAGGITSAAIDGTRSALALMKEYKP